jgi:hypothetical protein
MGTALLEFKFSKSVQSFPINPKCFDWMSGERAEQTRNERAEAIPANPASLEI